MPTTMESRAAHLISTLGLRVHPEGGHYREVFRSPLSVQPADERAQRAALTTIYFLLAAGEVSRWHRVLSDEVWHLYEGGPLELTMADPHLRTLERRILGPVGPGREPVHVVPAGCWQAAQPLSAFALVGCSVGPGFDFADFLLLRDLPQEASAFTARHPQWAAFL